MLQRPFLLWHDDDAGAMRQTGQRRRRLLQRLRQALAARRAQRLDIVPLVLGEVAEFQQTVHEQAQPGLGRQTPGRGVRRIEQPRLFEIGHHVADRRRRQVLPEQPRQRARADRLAGLHESVDDQAKNLAAAIVQLGKRRCRRYLVAPLTAFHVLATTEIRTAAAIGHLTHVLRHPIPAPGKSGNGKAYRQPTGNRRYPVAAARHARRWRTQSSVNSRRAVA